MKRSHKMVRALAVATVTGALTVVLVAVPQNGPGAILSLLGMEQTARASITKYILAARSCTQANLIEVNAGKVAGFGGGGWVAPVDCTTNKASKCIICEPMAPGALDEEVSSGQTEKSTKIQVTGTLKGYGCGDMYRGHCINVGETVDCVMDTGTPDALCKDVSKHIRQSL